jgi:hypothetical protein
MLFKNSVRTSKRTLHFTITKINWLTLFTFNPINIITPYLMKITLSCMTRPSTGSITLTSSYHNLHAFLISLMHATCPTHLTPHDPIKERTEQVMNNFIMWCSKVSCSFRSTGTQQSPLQPVLKLHQSVLFI